MYGHSGNEYRAATLSKSYRTTTGINVAKIEVNWTILTCLNERTELTVKDGPTLIIERHAR